MFYSAKGSMLAIAFVGVVGVATTVNRSMNYTPAKASVYLIDRKCKFTVSGGGKRETVSDSCNSTDEFKTIQTKRSKKVDGKAVAKVSYTAPQDGSYQTSQLTFDGRDDEFYALKAGDTIEVLVSNADVSRIIAD